MILGAEGVEEKMYKKTTCQFQLQLQMSKTLQQFTNIFTLNTVIFTNIKFI
jgi:hypothetical protein